MKLTPMITFVKKQGNIRIEVQSIGHQQSDRARRFYLIQKYADFLLKGILKEMFVPCDENDVPLVEPKDYDFFIGGYGGHIDVTFQEYKQYQQAKNRVLFKGFKVRDYRHGSLYSKTITDETGLIHLFWFDKITETWEVSVGLTTIESLTKFGGIELTETALKEIGIPNNETNE